MVLVHLTVVFVKGVAYGSRIIRWTREAGQPGNQFLEEVDQGSKVQLDGKEAIEVEGGFHFLIPFVLDRRMVYIFVFNIPV